jgi:hypothetical protein
MVLAKQSSLVAMIALTVFLSAWAQGIDYAKIKILTEKLAQHRRCSPARTAS